MAKKQEILRRSAELFGRKKLAERLKIPETLLEAWMSGDATMPDGQLIRLAELLVELADPGRTQGPAGG